MILSRKLSILGTAVALTACADLMRIDFESDPLNQPPLSEPPSPQLDLVNITPAQGDISVVDVDPIAGSRSLRIAGPASGTVGNPRVRFQAQPLSASDRVVLLQWSGQVSAGAVARIEVGVLENGSDINLIPPIRFEGGEVFVGVTPRTGYTVDEPHLISATINLANGDFTIVIERGVTETQVIEATSSGGGSDGRTLWIDTFLVSGDSNASYRVDSVFGQDRGEGS
ncbi:MAG: hypothetical protein AAGL66_05270 [Pseudomonadota bacterium]